MTFSRFAQMVGKILFFVYLFLNGVRSIKEVRKPSRTFWIYISIFTQPICFILVFLFFKFYCNIYVTNPLIDLMRSITEDISNVTVMSELTWTLCDGGQYSKTLTDYYMIYYLIGQNDVGQK